MSGRRNKQMKVHFYANNITAGCGFICLWMLQKAWNDPHHWVQHLVIVFARLIAFHHIYEFPTYNDQIGRFTFSSTSTH